MSLSVMMKSDLNEKEMEIFKSEMEKKRKNKTVAFILWLFTGGIGGHRYYLEDYGMAVAMTLTIGGLGFWALIDGFFVSRRVDYKNEKVETEIIEAIKRLRK